MEQPINMFTDPVIGPPLTVIFIICCLAGIVFLLIENWPKIHQQAQPKAQKVPDVRYEQYIVVDDEIIYPVAVVDHIDTKV